MALEDSKGYKLWLWGRRWCPRSVKLPSIIHKEVIKHIYIHTHKWDELLALDNTIDKWPLFLNIHDETMDKCVTYCRVRVGPRKPKWMNRRSEKLIGEKERAWLRYKNRKTIFRRQRYNFYKNKFTKEIRWAKFKFDKQVALDAKDNASQFGAYVRNKTDNRDVITRIESDDGTLTTGTSDNETAETMNQSFNRVFVREDLTQPVPLSDDRFRGNPLINVEISHSLVSGKLVGLKTNIALGPDSHQWFWRLCRVSSYSMYWYFPKFIAYRSVPIWLKIS